MSLKTDIALRPRHSDWGIRDRTLLNSDLSV